jgi:hypothetical protein
MTLRAGFKENEVGGCGISELTKNDPRTIASAWQLSQTQVRRRPWKYLRVLVSVVEEVLSKILVRFRNTKIVHDSVEFLLEVRIKVHVLTEQSS